MYFADFQLTNTERCFYQHFVPNGTFYLKNKFRLLYCFKTVSMIIVTVR